jgi:hypothetical protein
MYTGNMLMNALIETFYEYDDANHANCSGPFLSGRQSLIGARIGACADLIFFFFPLSENHWRSHFWRSRAIKTGVF